MRYVDSFRFCSECSKALTRKGDRWFFCEACKKDLFINPHVTACVILENSKKEILLTERAHDPFRGMWGLPGGFVEPEETAEEAIRREIKEELGLTLRLKDLEFVSTYVEHYPFQGVVLPLLEVMFYVKLKRNIKVKIQDDISDAKWISWREIPFKKIPFPGMVRALRSRRK